MEIKTTRSQIGLQQNKNMAAVVDLTNNEDENQELRVMMNTMAPVPKNTVGQGCHHEPAVEHVLHTLLADHHCHHWNIAGAKT